MTTQINQGLGNQNPDPLLKENVILTTLDALVNWMRKGSVWPLTFGTACCAIEMMATYAAKYDLDRFGAGIPRATPRQADLMIVAGTVNHKMAPRVKRLFDQMPDPKFVLAMGGCVIKGGPYGKYGYHVVQGVDRIIPVDVYVPGCPPRPEALIEGLFRIQERIMKEKIMDRERLTTRPKVFEGREWDLPPGAPAKAAK
jgi:NADH-quinone oxidoreductase subunit B